MIRFLLKHDKLLGRMESIAMYSSGIVSAAFWIMKWSLLGFTEHVDDPSLGIIIFQLAVGCSLLVRATIWFAYHHGFRAGISHFDRFKNCRIQEIPGMKRPIFIRPDDPGAKP